MSLWAVDSGCSQFICNDLSQLSDLITVNLLVRLGDETTVNISCAGIVKLFDSSFYCLYAPSFRISLISVPVLDSSGFSCVFEERKVNVLRDGAIVGVAYLHGGCDLYLLNAEDMMASPSDVSDRMLTTSGDALVTTRSQKKVVWKADTQIATWFLVQNRRNQTQFVQDSDSEEPCSYTSSALATLIQNTLDTIQRPLGTPARKGKADINRWHCRLGHVNFAAMNHLLKKLPALPIAKSTQNLVCDTCVRSSLCQRTGKEVSVPRSLVLFERVHADLCGPFRTPTRAGSVYYAVFVEDSTRFPEVILLQKRSELRTVWKQYCAKYFTLTKAKILFLRSDNGGEFVAMEKDLLESGIQWERALPYTQHSNGVAERMVRSINTKARALMLYSACPDDMWGEAVSTAGYLYSLILQQRLADASGVWHSPHELMYGVICSIKHLKVFGCLAYQWLAPAQRKGGKWVGRASPCALVGYIASACIYRLFDLENSKFYEASSCVFREDVKAFQLLPSVIGTEDLFSGMYEFKDTEEDSQNG